MLLLAPPFDLAEQKVLPHRCLASSVPLAESRYLSLNLKRPLNADACSAVQARSFSMTRGQDGGNGPGADGSGRR